MTAEKKKPEEDEITDVQLEEVAGGIDLGSATPQLIQDVPQTLDETKDTLPGLSKIMGRDASGGDPSIPID